MAVGTPASEHRTAGGARPGSPRFWLSDARGAWAAFGALAAIGLAFVMWKGRGNGFFFDEWGWIESRRTGLHAIFSSYNQHIVIVPVAAYQVLLSATGLAHYWVYRLLAAVAHLAVAAGVFAYAKRRLGAAMALLPAAIVVFLGSGWEYVLQGVNFGFTSSLAFGIAALIALDRGDHRGDLLACGALVVGLPFSEFVVLFALGIAIELTWRDRSLHRAWVWSIPIALYAVWWLAYYTSAGASRGLAGVPKYVANMASSAAGGVFGLDLVDGRPVLIVLAALVAWRVLRRGAMRPRLGALLTMLAAFWLLVAIGRAQLGEAWASRYVYTGAVLILLVLVESFREVRLTRWWVVAIIALVCVSLVENIRTFDGGERYLHTGSQMVTAELGALQLARAQAPPGLVLDPRFGPQIIAGPYFAAATALHSNAGLSPAQLLRAPERARAAADRVLVRAGDLEIAPPSGTGACTALPATPAAAASGATGVVSAHDLQLPASGIELRLVSGATVQIRARRFATTFEQPPLPIPASTHSLVIVPRSDGSLTPWHLRISPPAGLRLCALPGARSRPPATP